MTGSDPYNDLELQFYNESYNTYAEQRTKTFFLLYTAILKPNKQKNIQNNESGQRINKAPGSLQITDVLKLFSLYAIKICAPSCWLRHFFSLALIVVIFTMNQGNVDLNMSKKNLRRSNFYMQFYLLSYS